MSSSCLAKGCRYFKFHTTLEHQCSKCQEFGHGDLDCINNLIPIYVPINQNQTLNLNLIDHECPECHVITLKSHKYMDHLCDKCRNLLTDNHGIYIKFNKNLENKYIGEYLDGSKYYLNFCYLNNKKYEIAIQYENIIIIPTTSKI